MSVNTKCCRLATSVLVCPNNREKHTVNLSQYCLHTLGFLVRECTRDYSILQEGPLGPFKGPLVRLILAVAHVLLDDVPSLSNMCLDSLQIGKVQTALAESEATARRPLQRAGSG